VRDVARKQDLHRRLQPVVHLQLGHDLGQRRTIELLELAAAAVDPVFPEESVVGPPQRGQAIDERPVEVEE
jgi:hypothetical protein